MTAGHRTITVTLPADPCGIVGDSLRLEQVIINLVQNALKYSPYGGAIQVTLRCDPDRLWVAVQDAGMGIPAAALPYASS